jgi:hypothetical protein
MSNDETLSPKEMDFWTEAAEADTRAVVARNSRQLATPVVTKAQLDTALAAWEVARDRAMHEHQAWGLLMQSHSGLISSLRASGHSWDQADAEFKRISEAHRSSLLSALTDMDEKCRAYQELLAASRAQS